MYIVLSYLLTVCGTHAIAFGTVLALVILRVVILDLNISHYKLWLFLSQILVMYIGR